MARHAASNNRRRALLRAGLTVAAAGAALGSGGAVGAVAQAAPALPVALPTGAAGADSVVGDAGPAKAVTGVVANSVTGAGQLKSMQLHPLANTGVDPLSNGVGTKVADFKPVGTTMVTDHLTHGQALEDLPLVGPVAGQVL
ncbi:hypothetical protein [Streptomyces sp. NPDC002889]|uniref:hypothetical protein n=1 Tax=Streptomyces sp. NPDC002889 TaxID=3364669 RepID=UPI0036C34745